MNREEAIKIFQLMKKILSIPNSDAARTIEAIDMAIEALSVEDVQGEWIEKDGELVCSVCGNSVSFSRTPKGWVLGKFCQSCGAKMVKGGDTE